MRWFRNLRMLLKLLLGFGAASAVLAGVGYFGVHTAEEIFKDLQVTYERDLVGLQHVMQANVEVVRIGRLSRAMLLATEQAKIEENGAGTLQALADMNSELHEADKLLIKPEAHALVKEVQDLLPDYSEGLRSAVAHAGSGKRDEAIAEIARLGVTGVQIDKAIRKLVETKIAVAKATYQTSDAEFRAARVELMAMVLGGRCSPCSSGQCWRA